MVKVWATIGVAFILLGCVESEVIVLKNPMTGEVIQCSRNSGASFFPIAQTLADNSAARNCAKGYEGAGWMRTN